jgi:hypothetical protein
LLPLPQAPPLHFTPFIPLYCFFLLLLTTLQFSFLIHVPVSERARHRLGEGETMGPGITNEALDLGHTLISRSCSQGPAKWALTPCMLILIYRSLLCYKVLVRIPERSPLLLRSVRVWERIKLYCNRFDQRVAKQQLCKQYNTHTHTVNNKVEVYSVWSAPRNSRLLLLGNGAVNIPSQQYNRRGVFYYVRAESI